MTLPYPVFRYETLDSTNEEAKRIFAREQREYVVVADRQTAGKGRNGRTWISPPGLNLTASFVVRPRCIAPEEIFLLSEAAAVAAVLTLRKHSSSDVSITAKWPNDVMSGNKKIAGILIENVWMGDKMLFSAVGFGINVNQTAFEGETAEKATSLALLNGGKLTDLNHLLRTLDEIFQEQFRRVESGGADDIEQSYHRIWGDRLRLVVFDDNQIGIPLKVRRDGRIEIQTQAGLRAFALDEIRLRYPPPNVELKQFIPKADPTIS